MITAKDIVEDLLEVIDAAIRLGHWKVDGSCDPDLVLYRAKRYLEASGAFDVKLQGQP